MTNRETRGNWPGTRPASFRIVDKAAFHHANGILGLHPEIERQMKSAIQQTVPINCIWREANGQRRPGIVGAPWDKATKAALSREGWRSEVTIKDGVFHRTKSKFERIDLAKFDELANLRRFWNNCFGSRPARDGDRHWKAELKKTKEWKQLEHLVRDGPESGADFDEATSYPTIIAEIQRGNWGHAQRDFFKVLTADFEVGVDLFVYVVPTGTFSSLESSGTVSFDLVKRRLSTYQRVVKVPTLILGVDVFFPGTRN